jgi:isochorismate hydrolase
MPIPDIKEYSLKQLNVLTPNVPNWKVDSTRCLLLVHDMQNYFIDSLPDNLKKALILNCAGLIRKARALKIPIVYTAQCGGMTKKERGLLVDFWGPGMKKTKAQASIAQKLLPLPEDSVINKWRYSAFFNTNLADILISEKRNQLIICGVYAHIGVLFTAIDAYSRDIEVFFIKDAVADFSKEAHLSALNYAAECCAMVVSTDEILN